MTVYTQGVWDLFHCGHVNILKRCSAFGDVIVAVLTDESVLGYKGKLPVMNYDERCAVVRSCKYVSSIVKNNIKDTGQQIIDIGPDIVAIGTDWATKDLYKQYGIPKNILDKYLIYIPYTEGVSSTIIKKRINEQMD